MDLKVYYAKIREAAAGVPGDFAVVVSLDTPDGGRPGVMNEAPKEVAARLIVEGRAKQATAEQAQEFYQRERELKSKAERELAPTRLQVAVLSEKDLEALKASRTEKSAENK